MHKYSNYRGPRRRTEKKGNEKNFEEIIVENFPNVEKEIVNQVQEAQTVMYRINPRRNTPRHILIKLTKTKHKERILNAVCLTAELSPEILQARRQWQNIFKLLKR